MGRLSSGLYLRKAGKVLLRKGRYWWGRDTDALGDAERPSREKHPHLCNQGQVQIPSSENK